MTPEDMKAEAEKRVAHKLNVQARHLVAQRALDAVGPILDRRSHLPSNKERREAFDAERKNRGMICPTCKGTGGVEKAEGDVRPCLDCEGYGVMDRDLQSRYYGESGYADLEDERALERERADNE